MDQQDQPAGATPGDATKDRPLAIFSGRYFEINAFNLKAVSYRYTWLASDIFRNKWRSQRSLHGRRFTKSALSANFRRKSAPPTNPCWCQKIRLIVHSCGIKISAVHCTMWSLQRYRRTSLAFLRGGSLYC